MNHVTGSRKLRAFGFCLTVMRGGVKELAISSSVENELKMIAGGNDVSCRGCLLCSITIHPPMELLPFTIFYGVWFLACMFYIITAGMTYTVYYIVLTSILFRYNISCVCILIFFIT